MTLPDRSDCHPARMCEAEGPEPCHWYAKKSHDDAMPGTARCWLHEPEHPAVPEVFDAPAPARPSGEVRVGWLRDGETAWGDGVTYRPRGPRGPHEPW